MAFYHIKPKGLKLFILHTNESVDIPKPIVNMGKTWLLQKQTGKKMIIKGMVLKYKSLHMEPFKVERKKYQKA